MILHGRGLCPGFFEGHAHVLDAAAWIAAAEQVASQRGPEREMERLRAAQANARDSRMIVGPSIRGAMIWE